MKYHWDITQKDIDIVSQFVEETLHSKFVSTRYINNIQKKNVSLSIENVWKHITMCLLTTQQRSGPNSNVNYTPNCRQRELRELKKITPDNLWEQFQAGAENIMNEDILDLTTKFVDSDWPITFISSEETLKEKYKDLLTS